MDGPKDRGFCPDCDGLTRREFLRLGVGGAALALTAGATPLIAPAEAAAKRVAKPETVVKSLYESLTEAQRKVVAFPWDHALRSRVENNWAITPPSIGEFFNADQQAMIGDIVRSLYSEEYYPKVMTQWEEDAGGIGNHHVALFGTPGSGKFEWVLSGRHCTLRCDGDSLEGAAFGGPIFYGHASRSFNEAADHPGNVYWYQAKRANAVYKALDGKQREMALVKTEPPPEQGNATVRLRGKSGTFPGMPVEAMSRDQKGLVKEVLADLLLPYRRVDQDEVRKLIDGAGGMDALHMAFYQQHDIGDDGVWDMWRLEGPAMVWYFRGSPHVHTWVHIRQEA